MTTGCLDKINVTALESNKINFWDHLESSELVLETFLWSSATNKTIHCSPGSGMGWLVPVAAGETKTLWRSNSLSLPLLLTVKFKIFSNWKRRKNCILRRLKRIWQFEQEFLSRKCVVSSYDELKYYFTTIKLEVFSSLCCHLPSVSENSPEIPTSNNIFLIPGLSNYKLS